MIDKYVCALALLVTVAISGCHHEGANDLKPVSLRSNYPDVDKIPLDHSLEIFEDKKTHLKGYKDQQGHVVIAPAFAQALPFSIYGVADVAGVPSRPHFAIQEWYKINKKGEILVQLFNFDNGADYYVNGLSRFVKNNKIGFINLQGEIVIPAVYDWASPFGWGSPYNPEEAIAIVCQGCKPVLPRKAIEHTTVIGGKWGAINSKGKIIVPLEFDNTADRLSLLAFRKAGKDYIILQDSDCQYHLEEIEAGSGKPYRNSQKTLLPALIKGL